MVVFSKWLAFIAVVLSFLGAYPARPAFAQPSVIDTTLNESVKMVRKQGLFSIDLETTTFKPDGDGPFPVALINHGKANGDPRFQVRYRPTVAVRYFLQRGYAVVVPMRQGFSKSGGSYIGGGCNVESNGRVQAEDVKAVLDDVVLQPWADKTQMLVLGQSHGGWTTLAFGALGYPGVKALVNFAGGLRQEGCVAWENNLALGAANYARQTLLPSLWFYGDNDSYFQTSTYRAMFEQYTAAGGKAQLVAFGTFGADAHSLFGAVAGQGIWQPEVSKFLQANDLPSAPLPAFAKFAQPASMTKPLNTSFALLVDETKVPYLKDSGRAGYKNFLTKLNPRAFAIGSKGAWSWADGGDDPLKRALDACNRNAQSGPPCKLYAVDDAVVWTSE